MAQKITLGIIILIIALIGSEAYSEFIANHTYYYGILQSVGNWKLLAWALIAALIPTLYIVYSSKSISLKTLCIAVFGALFVFSLAHISSKAGDLPGIMGPTGLIRTLFNIFMIFGVSVYFIVGIQALGHFITHKVFHLGQYRVQEMFLSLGLGLISYVLVVDLFLHIGILHPIVMWIIFLSLGGFIYMQKVELQQYKALLTNLLQNLQIKNLKQNPIHIFAIVLIVFSLIYYFFGFNLSYIPYPTAWDANHAYMFYPKVWASNRGIYWSNGAVTTPHLWNIYITSWFSLFQGVNLGIAADTRAVSMNFLSGIFVLMFGVALIHQATHFFSAYLPQRESSIKIESLVTYSGWLALLLRLTSGMGAFLVFIDNKTDLGVMALTTLALLSGFIFLWMVEHKSKEIDQKQLYSYIIISGIFFAAAALAKPTAMQDIILFVLMVLGLWVGVFFTLGAFLFVIGALAKINEQGFQHFDLQNKSRGIIILGLITMGANTVYSVLGQKDYYLGMRTKIIKSVQHLKYMGVWMLAIIISLVVVKGPYMVANGINNNIPASNIIKNILMGYNLSPQGNEEKVLLTQLDSNALEKLSEQSVVDQTYIQSANNLVTPAQCAAEYGDLSLEELNKDLKKELDGGGLVEDLGRYIWKQGVRRKAFKNPSMWTDEEKRAYGPVRLGYRILSLFVRGEGCHSWNSNAKLLCENANLVATDFDKKGLTNLMTQMRPSGNVYTLLQEVMNSDVVKSSSSDIIPGNISYIQRKKIQDIYQHRVIYKDVSGTIFVPYKNLIPLNVIFNWSLQNLSSYYTDIGFFWIIPLLLLLIGFIYSLARRHYELFVLQTIAIAGWVLWWLIAHAIIWYAVGLILWTILANIIFLRYLYHWLKDESDRLLYYVLLVLIGLFGLVQIIFNYTRISSQGINGQFVWYRTGVGYEFPYGSRYDVNGGLQIDSNKIDYSFNAKDLFDIQFGHYNQFLDTIKNRSDEDGLLVAGMYMRYFIENQRNILDDGLLGTIGKYTEDQDPCKFYMRLKKNNLKYLAIDPNISSVASSTKDTLFTRFLADIDPVGKTIITDGVFTMMAKLVEKGYAKLMYSNNLSIQYSYGLSNDELLSYINSYPEPTGKAFLQDIAMRDMSLLRGQMMAARFFGQQEQAVYSSFVGYILQVRLQNGQGLQDMAYVYGKSIDPSKIIPLVQPLLTNQRTEEIAVMFNNLTKDEKFILTEYLQYNSLMQRGDRTNLDLILRNMLNQSLGSPSQLATFELL